MLKAASGLEDTTPSQSAPMYVDPHCYRSWSPGDSQELGWLSPDPPKFIINFLRANDDEATIRTLAFEFFSLCMFVYKR